MDKSIVCSIDGCGKKVASRGWCESHYQRWRKHGDPMGGRHSFKRGVECLVDGCEKPSYSSGLCNSHRHKKQRYGDPEGGADWKKNQRIDFIRSVEPGHDGCILWPYHVGKNGYGDSRFGGYRGAHAVMCYIHHGDRPSSEHEVAHSCGNRKCVNPDHLRWATKLENASDRLTHGTQPMGERCYNAKLTASDVIEMRSLRSSETLKRLSDKFGVSISTVSRICRGDSWSWL